MAQDDYTQLVKLIQKGDIKAFEALYERLHGPVFHYCLGFTKSREVAEEILQEVFVKVWEKREQLDDALSVKALIYKMTRDLTFNYLKKASRDESLQAEIITHFVHASNATESQVVYNDYWAIAKKAIAQLPPQCHRIYRLRAEQGMSYEMIGDELGISKNTVKVQLVKATKVIKAYLYAHADLTFLACILACWC
jgi:RNA polymerase sigma-70 factor (ECF subfamily)